MLVLKDDFDLERHKCSGREAEKRKLLPKSNVCVCMYIYVCIYLYVCMYVCMFMYDICILEAKRLIS